MSGGRRVESDNKEEEHAFLGRPPRHARHSEGTIIAPGNNHDRSTSSNSLRRSRSPKRGGGNDADVDDDVDDESPNLLNGYTTRSTRQQRATDASHAPLSPKRGKKSSTIDDGVKAHKGHSNRFEAIPRTIVTTPNSSSSSSNHLNVNGVDNGRSPRSPTSSTSRSRGASPMTAATLASPNQPHSAYAYDIEKYGSKGIGRRKNSLNLNMRAYSINLRKLLAGLIVSLVFIYVVCFYLFGSTNGTSYIFPSDMAASGAGIPINKHKTPLGSMSNMGRDDSPASSSDSSSTEDYTEIWSTVNYDSSTDAYLKSLRLNFPCKFNEFFRHYTRRDVWEKVATEKTMKERTKQWEQYLQKIPDYDHSIVGYSGRGIVTTCGDRSFSNAVVVFRLLRKMGCTLPIELWHLGDEMSQQNILEANKLGVKTFDFLKANFTGFAIEPISVRSEGPNYQMKAISILVSSFEEVLFLDSDNFPVRDPTYLFNLPEYRQTGAMFWPDYWRFTDDNPMWKVSKLKCVDEWEFESGQILVDKRRGWKALHLSWFFQFQNDFYFEIILGDKDTFRFGYKLTNTPYHFIKTYPAAAGRVRQHRFCGHTMVQHDPMGRVTFLHTTLMKKTYSLQLAQTWETIQYYGRESKLSTLVSSGGHGQNDDGSFLQCLKNGLPHYSTSINFPEIIEYVGAINKPMEEGGQDGDLLPNPCLQYSINEVPVKVRLTPPSFAGSLKKLLSSITSTEALKSMLGLNTDTSSRLIHSPSADNEETTERASMLQSLRHFDHHVDTKGENGGRNSVLSIDEFVEYDDWSVVTTSFKQYQNRTLEAFERAFFDLGWSSTLVPPAETCGGGVRGNGKCRDHNECCSLWGWCGITPDHCGKGKCVGGPCS